MMDELKRKIEEAISEERRDKEKYLNMAEEARECSCDRIAGMLDDIAEEEDSHKTLLKQILREYAP